MDEEVCFPHIARSFSKKISVSNDSNRICENSVSSSLKVVYTPVRVDVITLHLQEALENPCFGVWMRRMPTGTMCVSAEDLKQPGTVATCIDTR